MGAASALVAALSTPSSSSRPSSIGRAAVLLATAAAGARLLPTGTSFVPWRRLDVVVGVLLVAAALYYLYRVLHGDISTQLPGEPGSGVLP